jgi:CBS domain-containing protein
MLIGPGTFSIDISMSLREAQELLRSVASYSVALTEEGVVLGVLDRTEILDTAFDGQKPVAALLPTEPAVRLRWAA